MLRTPLMTYQDGGELHIGKVGKEVDDKVPGAFYVGGGKTAYWC